jgi:hypothetical protein
MNNVVHSLIIAATLFASSGFAHAADPGSHGGHPPTAGAVTDIEGGTGSKSMKEGTQAGAPGNIVTNAEATVMTGHDGDADGYISKAEAAKNGELAKRFAKLDTNGDGKLDESEFKAFTPGTSAVTGTAPVHAKDASKSTAK